MYSLPIHLNPVYVLPCNTCAEHLRKLALGQLRGGGRGEGAAPRGAPLLNESGAAKLTGLFERHNNSRTNLDLIVEAMGGSFSAAQVGCQNFNMEGSLGTVWDAVAGEEIIGGPCWFKGPGAGAQGRHSRFCLAWVWAQGVLFSLGSGLGGFV